MKKISIQKAKLIKTKLSEQGDEYKFQKLKPVVKFTDELSFRLSDSEGEKFVNAILAWRNNKQICLSFEKDKITTTMGEHVEKIPLTDTTGLDSKPLSAKYCPQDIMTALAICSRVKGRDDIVFQFYKELIQMSGVGPEYSYEIIVSSLNDNGIQKTNGFELKI